MIRIEDHCVGCDLPCIGSACRYKNVEVHYCDHCDDELDEEFYVVDGEEVCESCLKDMFRKEW